MRTVTRAISLAALSALAGGCTAGAIDVRGGDDASEAERAAIESFDKQVMPILSENCAACHATMANIDFLKSEPDVRQRVMQWPDLVALDAPSDSLLLSKGAHEGPAFTIDQATVVLDWIQLERAAAGGEESAVEMDPFQPIAGLNAIDLGPIGLGGSTISFRMEPLSVGMYLSELMLTGGPDGAHLVHPLFVVWQEASETPEPDPIDRFAGLDLSVAAGQQAMIGGGTAVFVDVPPDSMLSLHFELAEAASGGGGGDDAPAGCKAVAAFTAAAQPALAASCVSCHGGANSSATNATNMAQVGDTSPEAQAAACAQILSRVNLADPPSSGIFVAPDPGSGASHPFKFNGDPNAFAAFQSQLTQWIDQEKAP
jgi:cytochrome c553